MTVNMRDIFYNTPGRVFIGRPSVGYQPHAHSTDDAIEVPEAHALAWLDTSRVHFPGAYVTQTWPKNGTVMARYNGTPDNKEVIPWR